MAQRKVRSGSPEQRADYLFLGVQLIHNIKVRILEIRRENNWVDDTNAAIQEHELMG